MASYAFFMVLPILVGLDQYGEFVLLLAVLSIAMQPLLELGLDPVTVKFVSRSQHHVAGRVLKIRLLIGVGLFPFVPLISHYAHIDTAGAVFLYVYLFTMALVQVVFSYYRGIERMKVEGILSSVQKWMSLLLLFGLNYLGMSDIILPSLALFMSSLFVLFIAIGGGMFSGMHLSTVKVASVPYSELLKEGLVLTSTVLLWQIYFRVDTVMLGMLSPISEVGLYNVAYKLFEGAIFLPAIIMISVFPALSKREQFERIFHRTRSILVITGLMATVAFYLLAPPLIGFIYGQSFAMAGKIAVMLSLALFPVYLGHLTTQSLIARDLSTRLFISTMLASAVNIILNFFLIPKYGATGAAMATIVAEYFVLLYTSIALLKGRKEVLNTYGL